MLPLCRFLLVFCALAIAAPAVPLARAAEEAGVVPLRLSYINGQASFWRYGAEDWATARINTPLAQGDALYVGDNAELELQIDSRAFIRADDNTQLSLVDQTQDFAQIKITSGRVSFDLRSLPANYSIEIDTPNSVFTLDHTGYYRVDVDDDVHFVTRRGGRATMVPAGGQTMTIFPSEEIVIHGTDTARAETYAAPDLDSWDSWNYERTNDLMDAQSERYLPSGVAGADDLDHYGTWRVVGDYGPVWVPDNVPPGWAPYSSGNWVWDPYYQWTWIDNAPWGWAPFHYGRWVFVNGYWMWAPGTVVVSRPAYSPALVAFFGADVRLGWVALGWGEPVCPWWGRPGFVGRPWWGGWGGPRVINNVVVRQTNVTNITNITYVNTRVNNAVIMAPKERFGRGDIRAAAIPAPQKRDLALIQGSLPVTPTPVSAIAGASKGIRPPDRVLDRPVVAAHRPPETKLPWHIDHPAAPAVTEHLVPTPQATTGNDVRRPQFGTQTGPEKPRPPLPPRYEKHNRQPESSPSPLEARPSPAPIAPNTANVRESEESTRSLPQNRPTVVLTPPEVRHEKPNRKDDAGTPQVVPVPRPPAANVQQPSANTEVREQREPERQRQPSVIRPTPAPQPPAPTASPRNLHELTPPPVAAPRNMQRAQQAAPQEDRSRERVDRPVRGHEELPGQPANRVFRRGPPQKEQQHSP